MLIININDKYIVALAKAAISELEPETPPEGLEWGYVFRKANEQSIVGLLYPAVSQLDPEHQPEAALMDRWRQLMLDTMGTMARRYNEFLRMSRLIAEAGITVIGLKGCIVRNLYPIPELRTMGDFDILIRKEDLKRIAQLFKNEGYTIENDQFNIVCHKQNILWEVFSTLEQEFRVVTEEMENFCFNSCVSDGVVNCPAAAYHLVHLIVHTGKHYVCEGAGIRNLCDIALFVQRYREVIDFETVKRLCSAENFGTVYSYLLNVAHTWFGVEIPHADIEELDTEKFLEYSLSYGIFGKHDNALATQAAKREDDRIGGLRKILFPSVKLLDYRYTYLKKFPFLLPVAWVHRFVSAVFKRKFSVRQMTGELRDAVQFSDERSRWLKELGIFETH